MSLLWKLSLLKNCFLTVDQQLVWFIFGLRYWDILSLKNLAVSLQFLVKLIKTITNSSHDNTYSSMETKASFTFWASWRGLGLYHQLLVKVVRVGIVAHVSQASPGAQVPSAILGLARRPFGLATARRAPVSCPAALLGLQQTHAHDLRTMHRPHTHRTTISSSHFC